VTFIDAGNGGGLMTLKIGAEVTFLDHRETAPVGAPKNMYLDSKGEVIRAITIIGSEPLEYPEPSLDYGRHIKSTVSFLGLVYCSQQLD